MPARSPHPRPPAAAYPRCTGGLRGCCTYERVPDVRAGTGRDCRRDAGRGGLRRGGAGGDGAGGEPIADAGRGDAFPGAHGRPGGERPARPPRRGARPRQPGRPARRLRPHAHQQHRAAPPRRRTLRPRQPRLPLPREHLPRLAPASPATGRSRPTSPSGPSPYGAAPSGTTASPSPAPTSHSGSSWPRSESTTKAACARRRTFGATSASPPEARRRLRRCRFAKCASASPSRTPTTSKC